MAGHVPAIRSENLPRLAAGTCRAMTVGRTSLHCDFRSRCTQMRSATCWQSVQETHRTYPWASVVEDSSACLAYLQFDDQLPEHVAALQPRKAVAELLKRINRVDHRTYATGNAIQRASECTQRRAERADDAILLLEQLHQVYGAGRTRRGAARHQSSA